MIKKIYKNFPRARKNFVHQIFVKHYSYIPFSLPQKCLNTLSLNYFLIYCGFFKHGVKGWG